MTVQDNMKLLSEKASLFAVPLKRLNKYAVVRVRFMANFKDTPYSFVDVLDVLLETNKTFDSDALKLARPLGPSLCLMSRINERGKNAWKFLFEDDLLPYEKYFPELRWQNSKNLSAHQEYTETEDMEWYYVTEAWYNHRVDYKRIKHLGYSDAFNIPLTASLIEMLWIRRLKLDMDDYYKPEDYQTQLFYKIIRREVENTMFYDTVPQEYWNKIMP